MADIVVRKKSKKIKIVGRVRNSHLYRKYQEKMRGRRRKKIQ